MKLAIAAACITAVAYTSSFFLSPHPIAAAEDLSLAVLRLPSDVDAQERTLLWAGIGNRTDRARLMCVAGWGYQSKSARGQSAAERSPHACSSVDVFRVVGGNQVLYWPIMLPVEAPPVDTRLRLEVTIIEREGLDTKRRVEHELSWERTLSDATSEARKLFSK